MSIKPTNRMIESLPVDAREFLLARLRPVSLPVGTGLVNPGQQPKFAHFMTSGIASIVTFMKDGVGAEVGMIGREGLVEGMNLLGPSACPTKAFMQSDGTALRMLFTDLKRDFFTQGSQLQRILEGVQCNGFILSQLAACHGLHEIDQRLSRWLLMVSDRLASDRFDLTQEFLAEMLGTRRTSVTAAAGALQRQGLIQYSRGHIQILNRPLLEAAACECYPIVRDLVANLYADPISERIPFPVKPDGHQAAPANGAGAVL